MANDGSRLPRPGVRWSFAAAFERRCRAQSKLSVVSLIVDESTANIGALTRKQQPLCRPLPNFGAMPVRWSNVLQQRSFAIPDGILADETVRLASANKGVGFAVPTGAAVGAGRYFAPINGAGGGRVLVDGKRREMTFLTNGREWAARIVADLYKARWEAEILFKELKQTLQIRDFYGENENAVKWQIWAALLTYLLFRCVKFKSGAS